MSTKEKNKENHSPVVGVLCIDVAKQLREEYGEDIRSYIVASYVKYLEGQGAHVIPIWIGRDREYYVQIMSKLNGVLLPGGAVFLDAKQSNNVFPNDCVQSAAWIVEIAVHMNEHGIHMPIWGTCLGYQLLVLHYAAAINATKTFIDFRSECCQMQCSLAWQLDDNFRDSKLLGRLSDAQQLQFTSEPIVFHYHKYCITEESFNKHNCNEHWRILAKQKDVNGFDFITMLEHKSYPFYGVQFHPERAAYEFTGSNDNCAHSNAAIEVAQYLARHFTDECRKSPNAMSDVERLRYSIYNFNATFTGRTQKHVRWLQCYLFTADDDYPLPPK